MSAARADVCVVGSANLDLVATAPRLPAAGETVLGLAFAEHAGGKGLNQAVAAARAGAATALCGCVGDDEAGRRLREVVREAGVRDEHVATVAGRPTGRALIAVSVADAQNAIVVVPGANLELSAEVAARAAAAARVVLAQLEVAADAVAAALAAARSAAATTILNASPPEAVTDELLGLCDHLVCNEHEAERLGGSGRLLRAGARNVVITLGARGSVQITADGRERAVASFAVEAVDTTAAGDAYCGAFAAALALGRRPEEALREASAAGALATATAGAVPSLPDRRAIDELLTAVSPRAGG